MRDGQRLWERYGRPGIGSGIVTGIGPDTDKDSASNIGTAGGANVGADSERNGGNSGNIGIRFASTAHTSAGAV